MLRILDKSVSACLPVGRETFRFPCPGLIVVNGYANMNTGIHLKRSEVLHRIRLYVLISSSIATKSVKETARLVIDGGADAIQ